jgi:hypothetical protein
MTDIEALQAFVRGESIEQALVRRLWLEGLLEVDEVRKIQSAGREYIATALTARGQRLLLRGETPRGLQK